MLPERVDVMLHNYREYSGRCKYLENLIPMLEEEVVKIKSKMASDLVSIGGMNLDGMPHGTGVGKPTERAGVLLADGYQSDQMIETQERIKNAKEEYKEKLPTVVFVEAWMKGLTERERWIVENQVIDSVTWREIIAQYHIKFGEPRTKRSLQMLRDKAMDKIYELAS